MNEIESQEFFSEIFGHQRILPGTHSLFLIVEP